MNEPTQSNNFWQTLPRPIAVLAPMEDVTDFVFRSLLKDYGAPEVYFTEFAMVRGIVSGQYNSINRMEAPRDQWPVVAQIWGNELELYPKAIHYLRHLKFAGIDINMGCPEPSVTKKGCCSALIKNHDLAKRIIETALEACTRTDGEFEGLDPLPLSVKTRIGFENPASESIARDWLRVLLSQPISALSIHARTAEQMSEGPAIWDYFGLGRALRDELGSDALIIGNGDIETKDQGEQVSKKYGLDGYMIGRGLFKNPTLFGGKDFRTFTDSQKISFGMDHLCRYEAFWGTKRNFEILKKFFKIYLQDFESADEIRAGFMRTHSYTEAKDYLTKLL